MNQWLADRRKKLFFLIDDDVDSDGDAAAADVFFTFSGIKVSASCSVCTKRGATKETQDFLT